MLFGLIVFIIGLLYLLEIIIPGFTLDWQVIWPLILIVIAVYTMFKEKKVQLFPILLLLVGIWFECLNTGLIKDEYTKVFWPTLIMIAGIGIIISTLRFQKQCHVENKDGFLSFYGIFGGGEEKVKAKDFKGANIYSIFGGVELDLRDMKSKEKKVVINCYSVFGGSDLILPEEFNVVLNSIGILGGNDNKNNNDFVEGRQTIYLNCISIFGGCDIK